MEQGTRVSGGMEKQRARGPFIMPTGTSLMVSSKPTKQTVTVATSTKQDSATTANGLTTCNRESAPKR